VTSSLTSPSMLASLRRCAGRTTLIMTVPNYFSVWTSTDNTAGRSRTIGAHVSPASGEA
jgi:hypothetical protein